MSPNATRNETKNNEDFLFCMVEGTHRLFMRGYATSRWRGHSWRANPHITRKSPGHKTALANLEAVRVAVNRVYGDLATPVADGDEIAFFPPVTGG